MSRTELKLAPVKTEPQKVTQTVLDTFLVTPEIVNKWEKPPFQRPLKINQRMLEVAQEIRETEVIPGVLTIGKLGGKEYLLDGQHRREAFIISECKAGFVDIRTHYFETMAELGREFVKLNSAIVKLKPDDILRGLEGSSEALSEIRKRHPWVGYDQIRRSANSPILSMSLLLRCWMQSAHDSPKSGGAAAAVLANEITFEDAEELCKFLKCAMDAWGRDQEYARLWGGLNLIICMWLYRRLVLVTTPSPRVPRLNREQFTKCLMSVSADSNYVEWLVGRQLGATDRSPAYRKIKEAMVKRLEAELGKKVALPAPAWASH